MNNQDEIITKVWKNREAYAGHHNHDLRKIIIDLQRRQQDATLMLVDRRRKTKTATLS